MATYLHDDTPEQYKGFGFSTKPNSPYVQLVITYGGQRYTYSTGTADYKEAMTFRAKKIAELEKGDESTIKTKGKMAEIFDAYVAYLQDKEAKAKNDYKRHGARTSYKVQSPINRHLKPFFGKMKISDVKKNIAAYDDFRQGEGASAPALNGEWRLLSAALNRGLVNGTVTRNDIPVKYPFRHDEEKAAARTGTISEEQYTKIMAELAPHLKPVFAAAVETGMRNKEMKFIRLEQVFLDEADLKRCTCGDNGPHIELRKGETKNGKARAVPIVRPDVQEILKAWRKTRNQEIEWFFQSDDGTRLGDFKTAWYAALRRSCVKGVMFYDSRRTAETAFDDNDVSSDDAQMMMGHNAEMRRRYNQSKKALKRVRAAMTPKETAATVPASPASSLSDLRAKLETLKELNDAKLLPDSVYMAKVAELAALV